MTIPKLTNPAPDHLRPARRALINRLLVSGHLPKVRTTLEPGRYPTPLACSTIATAGLSLLCANGAELAAPTLDYAQAAHRAAMRPVFAPVDPQQDPEFPEVFKSTSRALLADTQTPVDAQIHTCQLLAHGAAKHQLNVLRVFDDHKDAAQRQKSGLPPRPARAPPRYAEYAGRLEKEALALGLGSGQPKCYVGLLRRLFTMAPGNPKWRRSDVPILLAQIELLISATPDAELSKSELRKRKSDHVELYGLRLIEVVIYLFEYSRFHLVLHAAGIELAADKFAFLQLYMSMADDEVMERHVLAAADLAAPSTLPDEARLLCDALRSYGLDAKALTDTLIAEGIDMVGRRARRGMVHLLIQCFAWDLGNVVPATKEQLATFDKDSFETRLYALAYTVAAETHEKLEGLKFIEPDLIYINQEKVVMDKVLLELSHRREQLRRQPVILVSDNDSFDRMEKMRRVATAAH
ncbi:hypothetical protein H9P43_000187 [Blastocladiella emersonii ATCC 22665]|nr:hypothetical protein H9P43_000187 [Blastocladiella emersonii ATCC 22665]